MMVNTKVELEENIAKYIKFSNFSIYKHIGTDKLQYLEFHLISIITIIKKIHFKKEVFAYSNFRQI